MQFVQPARSINWVGILPPTPFEPSNAFSGQLLLRQEDLSNIVQKINNHEAVDVWFPVNDKQGIDDLYSRLYEIDPGIESPVPMPLRRNRGGMSLVHNFGRIQARVFRFEKATWIPQVTTSLS